MNDLKLDNHEKRRRGIKKEAWDFFVLRGIKKKKKEKTRKCMKEQVTRTILTGCTVHTFIHTIPLDGMIECMHACMYVCMSMYCTVYPT